MNENQTKVMRPMLAHFLNVTPGTASPSWKRIGKGVTGYTIGFNPNVTTEQYIDENNATNSVDSYAINAPIPLTCYAGEPIFEFLYKLYKESALGSDLETQVLDVSLFDKIDDTTPSYFAKKYSCIIQLDDFGGDAGAGAVMNGTILYNGDATTGTVTITNGTAEFTANVSA